MARRFAVLSTGRQDWGLLRPLCARICEDGDMEVEILAGGMALDPEYGAIVDTIRSQGFAVPAELRWDVRTASAWEQSAAATRAVGDALAQLRPDALVLLGDRFETAAAALAATVTRTPIVHLYGGEETVGAIDNALRHAITKLSHLHLVAHETYARRVVQMGEDPASVHVVGSLGVENAITAAAIPLEEISRRLGHCLDRPIGLVTVHPTTLAEGGVDRVVDAVIAAILEVEATWVITLPNTDPGHDEVRGRLVACAEDRDNLIAVTTLGEELYLALMQHASVVLGNSSSGMTEAPALGVPTVNVGTRQQGRIRYPTIVDVQPTAAAVTAAVKRALAEEKTPRSPSIVALGGDQVSTRIREVLRAWAPDMQKEFSRVDHDTYPVARPAPAGEVS